MDIDINVEMDWRYMPAHRRATKTKIKSWIEYMSIYKLCTKSIVYQKSPKIYKMTPSTDRARSYHKPDEEITGKEEGSSSKRCTRMQYGSGSCRLNLRTMNNTKLPNASSASTYPFRGSISNHHQSNKLFDMPSTLMVAIVLLASAHSFQSSLIENGGNAVLAYSPITKSGQHELPSSSTKDKQQDPRSGADKNNAMQHRRRDDEIDLSNRLIPNRALEIAVNNTSTILPGLDLPGSLNNLAHSSDSTIRKPTRALIELSTSASESSSDLVPSPNQLDDVALIAADSKKKKKMMKKKKKMEKKHKEWKKGKKHKKKKFEEKKKKGEMSKKKKGKKEKKKWGMEKKGHKKKGNFKKKKWGEKKKMKKGQKKGKKGHKMLKDKGHKKKGFKKIYHKEEWGKKKKWHDIKREKKWNTKQKKWKKKWHQEKGKKYKGKHMKKYHKKNKHGKKYKKEKKEKYKKHKGEKFKKGHKKKKEEYSKKKEGGKKKKEKKMKKEMKKKKG